MINKGQKLWNNAKKIIPGGNQLLSKRSEIFLPELWPAYYKKAKGCSIWDINNNIYYDFAGMGVTACTLGYADKDVDKSVYFAIKNGSMATLNSYEEVKLAEKLISLHPWSEMCRFARSGGEACSIAIRISRAASGKDKIAFCGYHGWHDWYLSSNLENQSNLDDQLLPGLKSKGVPRCLIGNCLPFKYNKIETLEKIINNNPNQIGTIIMEPQRDELPENNFLQKVKKIAKKIGAVLIFDEITSGFHDFYGGIHLKLEVTPDIAIFAKAIGNGYPISAIIGKKNVMEVAQTSFISSTMWTERIGFVASLATLNKMKKYKSQNYNVKIGRIIKKRWESISQKSQLQIKISGFDSIPKFQFKQKNSLLINTYFNQEMLKKGYLANNILATSISHKKTIVENYLNDFENIFLDIANKISNNKKLPLKYGIKHSTFKRLTGE